jgi:hypothetical protein
MRWRQWCTWWDAREPGGRGNGGSHGSSGGNGEHVHVPTAENEGESRESEGESKGGVAELECPQQEGRGTRRHRAGR